MDKIINGKLNGISPYYYAFNLCCNIYSVLGENSDLQKQWIINRYERDKIRLSKLGKEYRDYFNKVDEEIKNIHED